MKNIEQKLNYIQGALKAPKNQRNNFGGYNYRSCEDILEALKPLLGETKTTLIISDEPILVGDRFYIKATAILKDCENEKGEISASAYAREPLSKKGADEAQVTGGSSSYARKYCLNGLFCIDDTKDADYSNTHGKEQSAKLTEAQKSEILEKVEQTDTDLNALLNFFNVDYIENLTSENAKYAISILNKKLKG